MSLQPRHRERRKIAPARASLRQQALQTSRLCPAKARQQGCARSPITPARTPPVPPTVSSNRPVLTTVGGISTCACQPSRLRAARGSQALDGWDEQRCAPVRCRCCAAPRTGGAPRARGRGCTPAAQRTALLTREQPLQLQPRPGNSGWPHRCSPRNRAGTWALRAETPACAAGPASPRTQSSSPMLRSRERTR